MTGKAPPHNTDAEASVLAALMMGRADAALSLCPEDFYYPPNQRMYEAITSLHNEGQPVDQVTVAARMPADEKMHVLDIAGGYVPNDVSAHVEMVRDLSRRRATIRECRRIEALAYDDDALPEAMQTFMRLSDSGSRSSVLVSDIVSARLATLGDKRPFFVPPDGGPHIKGGNFVVVGGRPGSGKSALALWWGLVWSRAMRVALYSYEMDEGEIADRLLCHKTGTPIEALDESFTAFEIDVFRDHVGDLSKNRLHVKVAAGMRVSQLLASLRTFRASGGQVAIIDYVQLAMDHTKQGETADLTRLSNALRRLALDTGLTIIALSQFNRGMEGRSGRDAYPRLSDFRTSGSLEQDATAALLLYRYPDGEDGKDARDALREQGWLFDTDDPRTLLRCEWAKVRQGATGVHLLFFDGSAMRFETIDRTLNGGPL